MRECSQCHLFKDLNNFHRRAKRNTGYERRCKVCRLQHYALKRQYKEDENSTYVIKVEESQDYAYYFAKDIANHKKSFKDVETELYLSNPEYKKVILKILSLLRQWKSVSRVC